MAAVLLAAVCALSAFSQTGSGRMVRSKFVSVDGGFAIDLPKRTHENVRPIGSVSTEAGTFTWRVGKSSFTVGFVDGISVRPPEGFRTLNDLAATIDAVQARSGAKVVDICEFSFDGFPGIELRIERPGGTRAINRFILAGKRLYILTADWPAALGEHLPRGILDSFELTDSRGLVA